MYAMKWTAFDLYGLMNSVLGNSRSVLPPSNFRCPLFDQMRKSAYCLNIWSDYLSGSMRIMYAS